MNPSIVFDASLEPIVVVSWHGDPSDQEFEAYLSQLSKRLAQKKRVVYIMDATHSGRTPNNQRKMQGEWMKKNKEEIGQYTAGIAFVLPSAIFRFILSAIFLIQPLPCPYTVCSVRAEGLAWAQQQLDKASHPA